MAWNHISPPFVENVRLLRFPADPLRRRRRRRRRAGEHCRSVDRGRLFYGRQAHDCHSKDWINQGPWWVVAIDVVVGWYLVWEGC